MNSNHSSTDTVTNAEALDAAQPNTVIVYIEKNTTLRYPLIRAPNSTTTVQYVLAQAYAGAGAEAPFSLPLPPVKLAINS